MSRLAVVIAKAQHEAERADDAVSAARRRLESLSARLISADEPSSSDDVDIGDAGPKRQPGLLEHIRGPWGEAIRWYPPPVRSYTRRELLADGCVHAAGIALALAASATLVLGVSDAGPPRLAAAAIGVYCASLLAMLVCSAVYNVGQDRWRAHGKWLALMDHAGISLVIAGTFTPILVQACCMVELLVIWALMLATILAKAVGGPLDSIALHVTSFVFGPLVVVYNCWDDLARFATWELVLIVTGGVWYIGGLVPWSYRDLEGHVAVWHVCVLLGSASYFAIVQNSVNDAVHFEAELQACVDRTFPPLA